MRFAILLAAALVIASPAAAQVTSVTATATVTRTFKPDVTGNPIVQTVSGPTLAGNDGSEAFGSGSSFQSTSRVDPDAVYFKNANAAAGEMVTVDSDTVVNIAFRNDGATAVRPTLESTILPAGIGLFVGPNCLNTIISCGPDSMVAQPQTFNYFGSSTSNNQIAGASFDFRISSGSTVLYDLTGSLGYVVDPVTGVKSLVTDLDAASRALLGFGKISPDGSQTQFGFQWDATPIDVAFADLLDPGAESSLTYETRVTTYSYATCTTLLTGVCLNSYAAFGDPVGKGSSQPSFTTLNAFASASAAAPVDSLSFDEFRFALPTFQNGTLSYQPILASVPEPASWALLIVGFGLVGGASRRCRPAFA